MNCLKFQKIIIIVLIIITIRQTPDILKIFLILHNIAIVATKTTIQNFKVGRKKIFSVVSVN